MSARQALIRAAIRFYSHRVAPHWRRALTAPLLLFWPKAEPHAFPFVYPAGGDAAAIPAHGAWRRSEAGCDIEPAAGRVLVDGRLMPQSAPWSGTASSWPDLTARFGGKIIRREPALVLFAGQDCGIGAFAAELLPRFAALDRLGVPQDTLLLVSLDMARQPFFQDALVDGLFRPRPIEVLRPSRFIRTERLHEVAVPAFSPVLVARVGDLVEATYGLSGGDGPPVLLCAGGPVRAEAMRARLAGTELAANAEGLSVVDPGTTPLRQLVAQLGAAALIVAPDSGELGAVLLAPRPGRRLYEIRSETRPSRLGRAAAALLGEALQTLD